MHRRTCSRNVVVLTHGLKARPDGGVHAGGSAEGEAPVTAAGQCKTVLPEAFAAARDGDLAALRRLAAGGWDPLEEDRHGSNALLWAAGGGHLPVCRFLVEECGVSVDVVATASAAGRRQLRRRRNALHWAARHGHLAVCQCVSCRRPLRRPRAAPACLHSRARRTTHATSFRSVRSAHGVTLRPRVQVARGEGPEREQHHA